MRKSIQEPAFWLLVVANLFCLYYYTTNPDGFKTIVWVYWIQSVFIGIFNFLDLLTVKHPDPSSFSIDNKPIDASLKTKGCASLFFLFHYQFFHLAYGIFILIKVQGKLDILFLQLSILVILFEGVLTFIRNKNIQKKYQVNFGQLFYLPYLRIIPMHLMILAPAVWGLSSAFIFLALKTLADVGMYLLTRNIYTKEAIPATTTTI